MTAPLIAAMSMADPYAGPLAPNHLPPVSDAGGAWRHEMCRDQRRTQRSTGSLRMVLALRPRSTARSTMPTMSESRARFGEDSFSGDLDDGNQPSELRLSGSQDYLVF